MSNEVKGKLGIVCAICVVLIVVGAVAGWQLYEIFTETSTVVGSPGEILEGGFELSDDESVFFSYTVDALTFDIDDNGNYTQTITFEPMDNFVGKNVAGLQALQIPESTGTGFGHFMADIIADVKKSIQNKSEAQRKANETLAGLREQLAAAMTIEEVDALMSASQDLPQVLKKPFFEEMKKSLADKGFTYDGKSKKFIENETAA